MEISIEILNQIHWFIYPVGHIQLPKFYSFQGKTKICFLLDSPNFCSMNAIPGWIGMHGRQCSRNKTYLANRYEKRSCKTLCRACGLRVRRKLVAKKYQCNCKFNWCCNVTCDNCEELSYEYFCE